MSLSNVKPIYPNGIFPWTDKVDNSDIDFAANVNSLAAEVESIEGTVGVAPQVESSPPLGSSASYSTLSARVSDAMNNARLPYVVLTAAAIAVASNNSGQLVQFSPGLDPYHLYNGNDITIPANGWWMITSNIQWQYSNNGYSYHTMTLNGSANILDNDILDWEFPGNVQPVSYTAGGFTVTPPAIIRIPPRWQQYGLRSLKTHTMFQGPLHANDKLSVYVENGTSNPFLSANIVSLHAFMLRSIPSSVTFVSG